MRQLRYVGQGDSTGYGIAAASLVRALDAQGIAVAWEPLVLGPGLNLGYEPDRTGLAGPEDLRRLRDDARRCARVVLHTVPEYYPYFIRRERNAQGRAVQIWGSTVWETDRIPQHWPALINALDGLIVPTEWNRNIFRRCGVTIPIAVVPHLPQFAGAAATAAGRASLLGKLADLRGCFLFYSIGAWLERKGIGPLISAFAASFAPDAPVALVLKTTSHDLERERRRWRPPFRRDRIPAAVQLARMVRAAGPMPRVVLLAGELSEQELQALHERGDCYVSLCRAEGWGLGAFEAGWMGKPVVMTGWGGHTAYLGPETAYLVDWRLAPVRPGSPNASYTSDQRWAEPDHASAVAALRAVVGDPAAARRRGERLRQELGHRFAARRVASLLEQALWPEAEIARAG